MRINNFDKKISLLALTLFLLFISGCATTQVIDKIPPGIPKGFVEFRLQCYRASNSGYYNGFLIPTDFVVINEIAPDGSDLGIAAEKWGGSTLYLAARPGEHTYRFWFRNKVIHQSSPEGWKCDVRVQDGMLTEVLLKIVVNSYLEEGGYQKYDFNMSSEVEPTIPLPVKRN